jgi:hypothetical protein
MEAAIRLYEDEEIDRVEQVFVMDGRTSLKGTTFTRKSWSWNEGIWRFSQILATSFNFHLFPQSTAARDVRRQMYNRCITNTLWS